MNPLKGLIPGIVSQTILTKNVIHNLYVNMEWEESKKLVYEAIDYSSCINVAINSLDDTSRLVDATLDEIIRLKQVNGLKEAFSNHEFSKSWEEFENKVIKS